MKYLIIIAFIGFIFLSNVFAQNQEYFDVEMYVHKMLKERPILEVVDELVNQKSPANLKNSLIKLSVFARAGQTERVQATLKEIATLKVKDSDLYTSGNLRVFEKATRYDFDSLKLYCELFARDNDGIISNFINLWIKKGGIKEAEKWLAVRANQSEYWWYKWFEVKRQLGDSEKVYTQLEKEIRQNPNNKLLIDRYLTHLSSDRNINWLADFIPSETAYDSFQAASLFENRDTAIAIKFLQKSLQISFTDDDAEKTQNSLLRSSQLGRGTDNPEKQLRFWTKESLIKIYNKTNQSQLAQPFAEEIAKLDKSDIVTFDSLVLAGQTQSGSGKRVIESSILQSEEEKKNLPEYWIERAAYYRGRKEEALIWQTFKKALAIFPYNPNDKNAVANRLKILESISRDGYGDGYSEEKQIEIFSLEFKKNKKDLDYRFELSKLVLITPYRKVATHFSKQFKNHNKFIEMLAARPVWDGAAVQLLRLLLGLRIWSVEDREKVCKNLTILAQQNPQRRLDRLAYSVFAADEFRLAIPLLQESLKLLPPEEQDDFGKNSLQRALFESFINLGDWKNAEKLYHEGYIYWGYEPGIVAVVAAKSGNIADAVRLWKININLDNRNSDGLYELSKTDAKPFLYDIYLQMKADNPLSKIPDGVLNMLK